MATYMSSFHPVFWLHHNNIDRFYEKYLELHPEATRVNACKICKVYRTSSNNIRNNIRSNTRNA